MLVDKIKKQEGKFLHSPFYILTLVAVTLISWALNIQLLGLFIFIAFYIYVLLFNKDTSPVIPIILFSSVIYSNSLKFIDMTLLAAIFTPLTILPIILYIVKNKTGFVKGKYFYGLLTAAAALSLGGLFYDKDIYHFLTVGALSFLIVFLYSFFNSTTDGEVFKKTVLNSLLGMICIVLIQISIYYIRIQDLQYALLNKSIDLGWGNSNNAAFVLNILLPVTFYMSIKSKYGFLFLFLAFAQILGMAYTLSRGNLLVGSFGFVILLIVSFFNTKYKPYYIICSAVILAVSVILVLGNIDSIEIIKSNLLQRGLNDSGRFELWEKGINDFMLNPVFGVGFYKDFLVNDNLPLLYHNTLIQILGSLGVLGVLCFIPFFIQKYTITFKHFNLSNFYMFSVIALSAVYGLLDGNFTFIYNAFIIIFLYIVTEREKNTRNLFKRKSLPQ